MAFSFKLPFGDRGVDPGEVSGGETLFSRPYIL